MIVAVGLGGAIGAIVRYYIGKFLNNKSVIPLGTLLLNWSGSFGLGLLMGFYLDGKIDEFYFSFIGIGFFGAFTTFSTFSYETLHLIKQKKWKTAVIYVSFSATLGIVFAYVGMTL